MRHQKRVAMPLGIIFILGLACGPLCLTPASAGDKPTLSKLDVQPAGEPRPALKHRLLPSFIDRMPGNAALDYNRIVIQWLTQGPDIDTLKEQLSKWRDMPLEDLPREEIRRVLVQQSSILEGLARASRRDDCNWQLPLRESRNLIFIKVPEVPNLRTLANLVAVKARLEIVEGRFDDATQTLQIGYAMGQHIAESPLLIYSMVGVAVSNTMSKRVEELIDQPGSPNMYWSLTALPSPIVNYHTAIAAETKLLEIMFPEIRNISTTPCTAGECRSAVDRICESKDIKRLFFPGGKHQCRMALMLFAITDYGNSKKALIADGLSPDTVEAMPVAQVVALATLAQYRATSDNLLKWFGLPYWQACDGLAAMQKQITSPGKSLGARQLTSMLLPALGHCKLGEALAERNIAILRTVEALRLHAAANEGRLPSRLDEISVVPLPIDPVTGKPFDYDLKGNTAVIDTPAPQGNPKKRYHKIIEIQLIKTNSK